MFNDLIPGSYNLKFDLPAPTPQFSYHFTEQDQGSDETKDSDADETTGMTPSTNLVSGENDMTWDAGIYKKAEKGEHDDQAKLGNLLWIEDDNDGNPATGIITYPPAGTVVKAVKDDGKIFTAVTDANGHYEMWVDQNATYMVTVERLSFLTPTAGSDDSSINDEVSEDNHSHNPNGTTVNMKTVDNMTVDFGFVSPDFAHIGDYFWVDKDSDGIQDDNEEPVVGATVQLLDANGNAIEDIHGDTTQTTDDNGKYGFDVRPGRTYRVHFIIPQVWLDNEYDFVNPNAGGDDNLDSDVDSDGNTAAFTPQKGDIILTFDAGIKCPCSGVDSDSIDALGRTTGWILSLLILLLGMMFIRREDKVRSVS
jgi:hypothetical protein